MAEQGANVLAALALRDPGDIVIEDDNAVLAAGQVVQRVERLADLLVGERISRLGLLAANSADWIVADLACQKAGVCLLPLPPFFSDAQILNSLRQVGVDGLLTDDPARVRVLLANWHAGLQKNESGELSLIRIDKPAHQPMPAGTDKITFTSGSTGAPRGVCLSTRQQLRVAESLQQLLQLSAPRHLCLLPLSTLLENICGVYLPIIAAGSILVPPSQPQVSPEVRG